MRYGTFSHGTPLKQSSASKKPSVKILVMLDVDDVLVLRPHMAPLMDHLESFEKYFEAHDPQRTTHNSSDEWIKHFTEGFIEYLKGPGEQKPTKLENIFGRQACAGKIISENLLKEFIFKYYKGEDTSQILFNSQACFAQDIPGLDTLLGAQGIKRLQDKCDILKTLIENPKRYMESTEWIELLKSLQVIQRNKPSASAAISEIIVKISEKILSIYKHPLEFATTTNIRRHVSELIEMRDKDVIDICVITNGTDNTKQALNFVFPMLCRTEPLHREYIALTPEQKQKSDDDLRDELNIWYEDRTGRYCELNKGRRLLGAIRDMETNEMTVKEVIVVDDMKCNLREARETLKQQHGLGKSVITLESIDTAVQHLNEISGQPSFQRPPGKSVSSSELRTRAEQIRLDIRLAI